MNYAGKTKQAGVKKNSPSVGTKSPLSKMLKNNDYVLTSPIHSDVSSSKIETGNETVVDSIDSKNDVDAISQLLPNTANTVVTSISQPDTTPSDHLVISLLQQMNTRLSDFDSKFRNIDDNISILNQNIHSVEDKCLIIHDEVDLVRRDSMSKFDMIKSDFNILHNDVLSKTQSRNSSTPSFTNTNMHGDENIGVFTGMYKRPEERRSFTNPKRVPLDANDLDTDEEITTRDLRRELDTTPRPSERFGVIDLPTRHANITRRSPASPSSRSGFEAPPGLVPDVMRDGVFVPIHGVRYTNTIPQDPILYPRATSSEKLTEDIFAEAPLSSDAYQNMEEVRMMKFAEQISKGIASELKGVLNTTTLGGSTATQTAPQSTSGNPDGDGDDGSDSEKSRGDDRREKRRNSSQRGSKDRDDGDKGSRRQSIKATAPADNDPDDSSSSSSDSDASKNEEILNGIGCLRKNRKSRGIMEQIVVSDSGGGHQRSVEVLDLRPLPTKKNLILGDFEIHNVMSFFKKFETLQQEFEKPLKMALYFTDTVANRVQNEAGL